MTPTVHIDITTLLRDPIRTGIQRVERELIRHWPAGSRLVPVAATRRGFRVLPQSMLGALIAGKPAPRFVFNHALPADRSKLRLLNPELFFDPGRAQLYRDLVGAGAGWVGWLLYDFLPWLKPQYFHTGAAMQGMSYLAALSDIPHVAHISAQTQQEYEQRIMHGNGRPGPVVPLGGDGLGLARQHFTPDRRRFVVLGTLEPRKNVAAILEAFAGLWQRGHPAELAIIGMARGGTSREAELLHRLRDDKRLHYMGAADDATVRATLAESRALLTASEAEGFGLAPLEALHAGIPVIATMMPSIAMLPPTGQLRLAAPTPDAIAAAVETLWDDTTATRLWHEAATLSIKSWRSFAEEIAAWALSDG